MLKWCSATMKVWREKKNALSFHGVCTFSRMGRKYGVISYLINYCTEIDCLWHSTTCTKWQLMKRKFNTEVNHKVYEI